MENGIARETVGVGGVRVTVAHDDAEELAMILSTLEAVGVDDNGCDSVADRRGPWGQLAILGVVSSVSVCAYRHAEDPELSLGYSTSVERRAAERAIDAIQSSPDSIECEQDRWPALDTVVLRFHGSEGDADVLVRLDECPGYITGRGVWALNKANVDPWVVDGIGLYVSGGQIGNALSGLFRPLPG